MTNPSRSRSWPLLGLLVTWPGACSAPPPDAPHGPAAARVWLDAVVRDGESPGVQYVHVDAHSILLEHVAGVANVGASTPVESRTVFHGYSVTKTLTAAAVLTLAAAGKLDLDAPMSRWISGLPAGDAGPTVRQTLAHLGGFSNPVPIGWVHLAEDDARHDESAFLAAVLRDHGKLDPPGEDFAYSNVGYLALGEVVRRVSGKPYARYVEEDLLAPLGLDMDASLGFAVDTPAPRATGYVERWSLLGLSVGFFLDRGRFMGAPEGGWTPFLPLQVDGLAYGGLVGNARGFARYLQALLRREGPFTEEVASTLLEPGRTRSGDPTPGTHGWFLGTLAGEPYVHHAGAGGGYYAEVRVYPRLGRASVLLMNRSGMKDDRLLDALDACILP